MQCVEVDGGNNFGKIRHFVIFYRNVFQLIFCNIVEFHANSSLVLVISANFVVEIMFLAVCVFVYVFVCLALCVG